MKINSKKISAVLAVALIIGLVGATIYSRSYAERQKPFVQIGFATSQNLSWEYQTTSTVEVATGEFAELGVEWIIEFTIPFEAFSSYMDRPPPLTVTATSEMLGIPEPINLLRRIYLDNGDVFHTFEYECTQRRGGVRPIWEGEAVDIHARPRDLFLTFDNLVPPSALRTCIVTGGHYVLTVSQRQSAWGREYVANRVDVVIHVALERLGNMVVLYTRLPRYEPIVFYAEEPIFDGTIVRIFD